MEWQSFWMTHSGDLFILVSCNGCLKQSSWLWSPGDGFANSRAPVSFALCPPPKEEPSEGARVADGSTMYRRHGPMARCLSLFESALWAHK